MILFTNTTTTTTTKGQNNAVSNYLPNSISTNHNRLHLVCDASQAREAVMLHRFSLVMAQTVGILLSFVLFVAFFAVANAITGQGQETEAGHSSAWMGEKLVARRSQSAAREAGR
jgi:hypothetical protein